MKTNLPPLPDSHDGFGNYTRLKVLKIQRQTWDAATASILERAQKIKTYNIEIAALARALNQCADNAPDTSHPGVMREVAARLMGIVLETGPSAAQILDAALRTVQDNDNGNETSSPVQQSADHSGPPQAQRSEAVLAPEADAAGATDPARQHDDGRSPDFCDCSRTNL